MGARGKSRPAETSFFRDHYGAILFMAVFVFFWITLNPYADLVQLQSALPGASRSFFFNQLVALFLTGLLFLYAFRSPLLPMLVQPRVLLAMLFCWYLFVSAISPHPADAMKRTILAAMTCANASVFLILPRSDRQFAKLLLIGNFLVLAFAYFGVLFLPRLSIHQANELLEPMNAGYWRGHYVHKNVAAAVMLVAVFFGLFIHSSGLRKGGLAVIGLAVFFLLHTGGKSSTAMLPVILFLSFVFERWRWTRIPIALGGIAVFNLIALGSATSDGFRDIVKLFGVDPSFTNRTDIWKVAFSAIGQSPLFGYGFQGFWQTPELLASGNRLETWATSAFNGHNTYIDTLLTTGLPGLVLTLIWVLFLPLRYFNVASEGNNNPALSRLFLRLWLYGIYAACLESIFFQSGSPIWFSMVFSIFGLRMQAYARLSRPAAAKAMPARFAHA